MYAVETKALKKSFRGLAALDGLDMHVPVGSVYGFIGENGSGKSTTEKLICGHLVPTSGVISLFGEHHDDPGRRARVGALIENAGCFPESSIYTNLMMQALNLDLDNPREEIERVLKIVRMDEHSRLKFKKCSLGMKQRVGIALALLGNPALLILDEPINGLDQDGMRIMREVIVDIANSSGCTVLISSHILGELEKIATHYGIIREGKMIKELTAEEVEKENKSYVSLLPVNPISSYAKILEPFPSAVLSGEEIIVYDLDDPYRAASYLLDRGEKIKGVSANKLGLEQYYIQLMERKEKEL